MIELFYSLVFGNRLELKKEISLISLGCKTVSSNDFIDEIYCVVDFDELKPFFEKIQTIKNDFGDHSEFVINGVVYETNTPLLWLTLHRDTWALPARRFLIGSVNQMIDNQCVNNEMFWAEKGVGAYVNLFKVPTACK